MKNLMLALTLAFAATAAGADTKKCGNDRDCQSAQKQDRDSKSHKKHHHRHDAHARRVVEVSKSPSTPAQPTVALRPAPPSPAPILGPTSVSEPRREAAPQLEGAECLTGSSECEADAESAQAQELALAAVPTFATQATITRPLNPPFVAPGIWGANLEGYNKVDSLANYYSYIVPQAILASLNAKSLRFPGGCPSDNYDWQTATIGDTTPNRRPFLSVDEALALAKNANAELIYTLNMTKELLDGFPNPKPTRINPCGDYASFNGTLAQTKALVTRYRGRIRIWELANEPWHPFTPEMYRPVAEAYARAIKTIDPSAKVMIAGFSRTGNNQDPNSAGAQTVSRWNQMVHSLLGLRCATPAGIKPCFDTVQIHPYFLSGYESTAGWAIPDKDGNPATDRFEVLRQVLHDWTGTKGYFRQCPVSYTLGIRGDYCTPGGSAPSRACVVSAANRMGPTRNGSSRSRQDRSSLNLRLPRWSHPWIEAVQRAPMVSMCRGVPDSLALPPFAQPILGLTQFTYSKANSPLLPAVVHVDRWP